MSNCRSPLRTTRRTQRHSLAPAIHVLLILFYVPGSDAGTLTREFVSQVLAHPPVLIVDTSSTNGSVPSLPLSGHREDSSRPELLQPEMQVFLDWFAMHYILVAEDEIAKPLAHLPSPGGASHIRIARRRTPPLNAARFYSILPPRSSAA